MAPTRTRRGARTQQHGASRPLKRPRIAEDTRRIRTSLFTTNRSDKPCRGVEEGKTSRCIGPCGVASRAKFTRTTRRNSFFDGDETACSRSCRCRPQSCSSICATSINHIFGARSTIQEDFTSRSPCRSHLIDRFDAKPPESRKLNPLLRPSAEAKKRIATRLRRSAAGRMPAASTEMVAADAS